MLKLEILNELTLKVTSDGNGRDELFTKVGAWIGGECYGNQNWQFDRVLLGPEGNVGQAVIGQVLRRLTGENLPLVKVIYGGPSVTYFANVAQHVIPIKLAPGEQLNVESENLLAFYNCKYGVRFLGTGVLSQKGLATSTLTGMSDQSYAVILCDGNPLVISNEQNGSLLSCDPDALVAFTGKGEPGLGVNLQLKSLISRNGESYYFQFKHPTTVILQPNERESGLDIGIDGKGGKPAMQNNQLFRQGGNQGVQQLGNALGGLGGTMSGNGVPGQNLGNMLGGLGNLLNS